MTLLSWIEDYSIGVPEVDVEHRYLFDLINEFHDQYFAGAEHPNILRVLNRLIAYAEKHFQHEEELMTRIGYPHLDTQHKMHEALVMDIFALNERLSSGIETVSGETLNFLKAWLVNHIVREDMGIGDFMRRKSMRTDASAKTGESQASKAEGSRKFEDEDGAKR